MTVLRYTGALFIPLLALFWGTAGAQEAPDNDLSALACDPVLSHAEPTRYLRALSLDLRGNVPTADEIAAVQDSGGVDEAMIDSWLNSPDFVTQAVRFHEKLLWNNVDNVNLIGASFRFARDGATQLYYVRNRAITYRGSTALS